MIKALCGELVNDVMDDCLQFHGGAGYVQDSAIERMYRDARVHAIARTQPRTPANLAGKYWAQCVDFLRDEIEECGHARCSSHVGMGEDTPDARELGNRSVAYLYFRYLPYAG